ncbi:MAG: HAD family hydrolase [Ruminococcaceae bacterium]|nr:HAD family hydrolase [Oscillospiraceae bacterium]
MIKAVLFDLDGTLLPMDQDEFLKKYLKLLTYKTMEIGYDPNGFPQAVMKATYDMIANDGTKANEEVFWSEFAKIYGERVYNDIGYFDRFYENEFEGAREHCRYNPRSKELLEKLKEKGIRRILATNPVFPRVATGRRIAWAGLLAEDFELITTYENIGYCKPNLRYFTEILERCGLEASECLMVGNDVDDDMVAKNAGLQVFLLTDCLINKKNKDISEYPHGSFDELWEYINSNM